jgi:hypothetical protein
LWVIESKAGSGTDFARLWLMGASQCSSVICLFSSIPRLKSALHPQKSSFLKIFSYGVDGADGTLGDFIFSFQIHPMLSAMHKHAARARPDNPGLANAHSDRSADIPVGGLRTFQSHRRHASSLPQFFIFNF